MDAYEWGVKHGSCPKALEQRKAYASQPDWWKACNYGDWLIWQLRQLPESTFSEIQPALLRAINKIANRAVTNCALHCGVESVEQWAKKWLSREDRTENSARAAEAAAKVVDAAGAAARAAEAAEAAAKVAGAAARAAEAAAKVVDATAVAAKNAAVVSVWDTRAVEAAKAASWAVEAAEATFWAVSWDIEAAEAVVATELKQQAEDIRAEIPEWPGKEY